MKAFLALSCLVAIASARPDVSLGYRYPQPQYQPAPSSQYLPPSNFGLYAPPISGSSSSLGGSSSFSGSFNSINAPHGYVDHHSHGNYDHSHGNYDHHHHHDEAPIITKQFHIFSAPEEEQEQAIHKHITIGKTQKNYRVVFIRAPAHNTANARISAAYAPNEEKTVIYVLSKKPDEFKLEDVATPAPTEPSRPDVFFIKYKTQDEAVHAQHSIQAQYDALGGSSKVSDEGIAPISSVIGSLGGGPSGSSSGHGIGIVMGGGSHSHYITDGHHHVTVGPSGSKRPNSVYLPGQ